MMNQAEIRKKQNICFFFLNLFCMNERNEGPISPGYDETS